MCCYDCSKAGQRQDAVGICHHCSAGICKEHVAIVDDPVTMTVLVERKIILRLKARLLFCKTCLKALQQEHVDPSL